MPYRIAVDTGGTFTDVVVADPENNLHVNKALTNHARVYEGIREALGVTADSFGVTLDALLADTSIFIYATTRATNAILEGTTARTAFITTKGFRDTLVLREGGRPNAYDYTTAYPAPYVPRRLTFEVDERINSEGEIDRGLDSDSAREVLRQIKAAGVEAIGVSLLWSIANPSHELAIAALIEEELPETPYTLSHQINPIIREYRRSSSAVIDASLKPLMQEHLRGLEVDLAGAGFTGELLAATSFGGMMHIADLIDRPIYSTRSGPSMAPVAGKTYGGAEVPGRDVVICDTGGTSFDVSLVRDGEVVFTRETWLGGRSIGHLTGLSSVDARSIGAGGGSIAWVDPGGLLRIGPESAGSEPGPAAYGRGGLLPTVTDAAVVLGYLNPHNFLGGRLVLDVDAARTALDTVAAPLGISTSDAALAVMQIASESMVQAVQEMTVNEGVDPRECVVVAGGGAAGLNIGLVARELGAAKLLIPRTAGGLSACGAQFSDIISEQTANLFTTTGQFDFDGVNSTLSELKSSLELAIKQLTARGINDIQISFSTEARYEGQNWELEIPVRADHFETDDDVKALIDDFNAAHSRVFAINDPNSHVETLSWKVRLTAGLDKPILQPTNAGDTSEPKGSRPGYFPGTQQVDTPCYDGPALVAGTVIEGPAVIEEPTTTIVVFPGMRATVTPFRNYLMEMDN
ncbi:MAG: hydantoinase/oxoprolinase family protein [Rhodococcus sp. (in: high G+C Gram-positive bacteria)]